MGEFENIEYGKDEREDEFSNDDLFNIQSWGADPSVRELITQYEDGDIIKPELQRNYVWDKKEASRFIESLLLGLPIPSIFLANVADDKRLIIDGYQRLTTLVDYISKGTWKDSDEPFRLYNSPLINERWRNKTYKELSESDKRRLRLYSIHAIIFEQKKPNNDSGLYQVFERINTSGKTLNAQEIRNCVYQGDMNTLLFQLNANEKWRALYGSEKPDERMLDLELILRFFAMSTPEVYNTQRSYVSLKQTLNRYMSDYKSASLDFLESKEKQFTETIDFIYDRFDENAFFNLQNDFTKYRKKMYATIFDSLMIGTSIALERGFVGTNENLNSKKELLLRNQEYRDCITSGTMQAVNIHKRIKLVLSETYGMEL